MMLNWKYAIWTDEGKTFGPSGKESDCIQILDFMDDGRTIDEAINILFDKESIRGRFLSDCGFNKKNAGGFRLGGWLEHCTECKMVVEENDNFCSRCGTKLHM
jgi:hypothetical protein